MILRNLLFPDLCHRCHSPEKNFLCNTCLLGIELADYSDGNSCHLFEANLSFLKKKRTSYQELICKFTHVQLSRIKWKFSHIECEPELIYLKKYLEKNLPSNGSKILYLISRKDPILLRPMKKHQYILII